MSLAAAVFVTAGMLAGLGASPIAALSALVEGAFGSPNNIGNTIAKTTPLLLAGVGIAFALRAGLYNIGAEGQIYVGGLAATWAILTFSFTGPGGLIIGLVAGVVGGAIWSAIAGLLLARRGVSEVITTLLLNYVAIQLVLWVVSGPMHAPGATFPRSEDIPPSSLLPVLMANTQGHFGIVLGVFLALVFAWILTGTVVGYRVRTLQDGTGTPRYAGTAVGRLTVGVLSASGGLAGLAGAVEILGVHRRLVEGFSPGYGFDALAVALLARGNPIAVIPAALFFGILRSGTTTMQRVTGVPTSVVFVIQAVAVLFVIAGYSIDAWRRRRSAAERARAAQAGIIAMGAMA
ncbi:MAG: ABC transporter permease [Casimicrobiaceae bacterium]